MDKPKDNKWLAGMFDLITHAIYHEEAMFPDLNRMYDLAIVMNMKTYAMIEASYEGYRVELMTYALPRLYGVPIEIDESIPDRHVRLIHKTTRFEFEPEMVEGRDA